MLYKLRPKATSIAVTALLTAIAILVFVLFMPGKQTLVLQGTTQEGGEKVFGMFSAEDGTWFSVAFIHSVNQSQVKETYEIRNGEIYLISCLYSGFGAGVATEIESWQTMSYTDNGEMLIENIDLRIEQLSYIVGTVSDHIFEINGEEIGLSGLCGRNSTVQFIIRQKELFGSL